MVKKKEEVEKISTEKSEVTKKEPKKKASKVVEKATEEKNESVEEPVMVEEKVEAPVAKKYVVIADWFLNVRSVPSYNGVILKQLKKGAEVAVLETDGEWGRIGPKEWVNMKFLR